MLNCVILTKLQVVVSFHVHGFFRYMMLFLSLRIVRLVMCTAMTPVTFSCHWNTGPLLTVKVKEEGTVEYHTDRYIAP